ncbi:MAG: ligase-associated DNA damage response endonuclease PdeM [Rhodobacteraceae bacterium]|nr:ligase-associated DNA damage response endonuclease PdeM [Paracoccaceae bacterium]MCY4138565.1 ligase-associated DNA damage response endonuclease PdeM [Paracoccaceae bacterium]
MTTTRHSTGNETGFESKHAFRFEFCGVSLCALPDRALWWPDRRLLCVADLHLGKSGRLARMSGALLPPYETRETLTRLTGLVRNADPVTVVCLGDSFDDLEAVRELSAEDHDTLSVLARGRQWIWISGNHDPGLDRGDLMPVLGGGEPPGKPSILSDQLTVGPLTFRHIANPAESCEVSAHYHPKCRVSGYGRRVTRACFLVDRKRIILPAFGRYTGGLHCHEPPLSDLMAPSAVAVLTGARAMAVPARREN